MERDIAIRDPLKGYSHSHTSNYPGCLFCMNLFLYMGRNVFVSTFQYHCNHNTDIILRFHYCLYF